MKWTNLIAILALFILVGFLGNNLISCSRDIKVNGLVVEEKPPLVKIDIKKTSLFEYGYVSIGMSENVTLVYLEGEGWFALDFGGNDFAIYQRLDSWLDKQYKYKITERFIDNK